jgi:mono/diheme cytochrome c family protein
MIAASAHARALGRRRGAFALAGTVAGLVALAGACSGSRPSPSPAPPSRDASAGAPSAGAGPSPDAGSAPAAATAAAPAKAPAGPAVAPLGEDEGAALFDRACLSCHSAEFVGGSRIPEKGWNAEVVKMRKWGALVDEDQVAPLAAWLSRRYPAADAPAAPARMTSAAAFATASREKDQSRPGDAGAGKVAFLQACATCHGAAAAGLGGGPSLLENPVLWQRSRVTALLREGKGRMPAYSDLGAAQVADLLAFLRPLR